MGTCFLISDIGAIWAIGAKIFLGNFFISNQYCVRGLCSMGTMFLWAPCFYVAPFYDALFWHHLLFCCVWGTSFTGTSFMWHHVLWYCFFVIVLMMFVEVAWWFGMILKNHYGSWCPSGTLHEHFMDIFMNIWLIFWIGDERWVLEGSREFGCCNWVALSGCFVGLLCRVALSGCFAGLCEALWWLGMWSMGNVVFLLFASFPGVFKLTVEDNQ